MDIQKERLHMEKLTTTLDTNCKRWIGEAKNTADGRNLQISEKMEKKLKENMIISNYKGEQETWKQKNPTEKNW